MDNKTTYREASIKDVPSILKMNEEFFEYSLQFDSSLSNDQLTSGIMGKEFIARVTDRQNNSNKVVFVAEEEGQVVGYSCGFIPKGQREKAFIENVFLTRTFRGHGVGKNLTQKFINWCKSKGVKKILVEYDTLNSRAENFYIKRLGFTSSKEVRKPQRTMLELIISL